MADITITYGSYKFNPVPNIEFSSDIKRSDAGYLIGTTDKIVLNGLLFGSGQTNDRNITTPNNSFNNLMTALSGLSKALEKDYEKLEIKCGNSIIYSSDNNVTYIDSFDFTNSSDDNWLQIVNYSINILVYNTGQINYIPDNNYLVSNFVDTYNISTNNETYYNFVNSDRPNFGNTNGLHFPSYSITRNISANGIESKNSSALNNAKNFVSGLVNSNNHGLNLILSGLFIYDRSTEINQDSINGTYGINDTFIAYSGTSGWTDTYTVTSTLDQNLKRTVEIAGEVKGLERYFPNNNDLYASTINNNFATNEDYATRKWIAASGAFYNHIRPNILNKAINSWINNTGMLSGVLPPKGKYPLNTGINPVPLSISINHDISNGTIAYNYSYDSRPISFITEAITETLDINDSFSLRSYVFPEVFFGPPIAQDMGTYSTSKRSISYTATFPPPFDPNIAVSSDIANTVKSFLDNFNPNKLYPRSSSPRGPGFFSRVTENSENFDIVAGKYSYNVSWEYEKLHLPNRVTFEV